jgi:hypothetical protein
MAAGIDEKMKGMIPGVIAGFLARGGIILGKILIVVWVVIPLLAAADVDVEVDEMDIKRAVVVNSMANATLVEQGTNPDAASDEQYEAAHNLAAQAAAELGDEELNRRYEEAIAAQRAKAEAAEAAAQGAENQAASDSGEAAQPATVEPEIVELDEENAQPPSLVALFLVTMFRPVDLVFVVVAFAAAYKLGSGTVTS